MGCDNVLVRDLGELDAELGAEEVTLELADLVELGEEGSKVFEGGGRFGIIIADGMRYSGRLVRLLNSGRGTKSGSFSDSGSRGSGCASRCRPGLRFGSGGVGLGVNVPIFIIFALQCATLTNFPTLEQCATKQLKFEALNECNRGLQG